MNGVSIIAEVKNALFPRLAITAILIASFIGPANADVKDEIIDRCRAQMGEYGSALVKACVDQDIEALAQLNDYPDKYDPIIGRCMSQMSEYGYALVKACADQDIEAEDALSRY